MIDKLLKIAGKKDFCIDERIPNGYLFCIIKKYCFMILRGFIKSLYISGVSNMCFIGRNVSLIDKKNIHIGEKAKIHNDVIIDALSEEGVYIGKNVVLGKKTEILCTGSLNHVGKGLKIGDGSTFGESCFFGAAGGIVIGENVVGGQFIRFHAENHNYDNTTILIREQGVTHKGIDIGDNCWIGSGVVFLDGARLGAGCVVAANAVVRGVIPPNSVIGGIPAKIIKKRGNLMTERLE